MVWAFNSGTSGLGNRSPFRSLPPSLLDLINHALMEMDVITQQNQLSKGVGNISDNELNFEINAVTGLEDSEKPDNLDVSLKCSKIKEKMEEGNVGGKNLDSENEIESREEANVHANAEHESVEAEPSAARIKVMKLDTDDSNKEDDGGEKQQDRRDDPEQNKDFELSEVNEVPPVFNQDSLTEWKKEKQLEQYLGRLHKDAVEKDLFEVFGKFGEVQIARIVRHPTTNKSQGFAFIQYATVEQVKKVLSDLKDGIEVKGKRAKISVSHDRDILYLRNICKTWTKAEVLEKLKGLGIEDIDEIQVPIDPKKEGKIKGFAFLRFRARPDAKAALHRLSKPDAIFGNAKGAKVAYARSRMHPRKEVQLQVKTIYVQGIPKSWDVQKLREICEQYGETKKVKIFWNFCNNGKDFGSISFTTRTSAVACVEGMNKVQFGGGIKVKADIARPLFGGRLQKSTCGRLKLSKRRRSTEGAEKETDMKAQTVLDKSKTERIKEKAIVVVHKNNQDPSNLKCTIEGETNEEESITPEAHGAGLSAKPKKSDDKRKNRKRQRDRMYTKRLSKKLEEGETKEEESITLEAHVAGLSAKPKKSDDKRKNRKRRRDRMYGKRLSKKVEGSSQSRPSHSSRVRKSRSHSRKEPNRCANSIAYRIQYKEAYAAPTKGYPGYACDAISGSKRLSSVLEPHAGFVLPVRNRDQYHAGCVAPAFRHQGQTCAGYLKLDTQYEREPHAKYFKPALRKDALPHAGFLEPAFAKESFDGDYYTARRTGDFNSRGDQGPVYRAGSAFSRSHAPNGMSYARYEVIGIASGYHRVSGAYPPTQTHYGNWLDKHRFHSPIRRLVLFSH